MGAHGRFLVTARPAPTGGPFPYGLPVRAVFAFAAPGSEAGSNKEHSLSRLVVVSNRVAIPTQKGTAGGLAVALKEAFDAYPGLWFGWSGKVAAQPSAQPRIVDKGRRAICVDGLNIHRPAGIL